MPTHQCAVCGTPAVQCCSGCNTTYYCSREHQKIHWKTHHKHQCAPFRIETDEIYGKHLTATRNIKEGELIMRKPPILLAPKMVTYPTCLGCHKRLLSKDHEEFYECQHCKWPLCGEECETKENHKDECKILAASGFQPSIPNDDSKTSAYAAIGPLRALLLKFSSKQKYDILSDMQSHVEECQKTPLYKILKTTVVPFIQNVLKQNIQEQDILEACSKFDTNAFNIRDTSGYINIRGLYPVVYYMSHDCKHNTKHSFEDDDHKIYLIATSPISKGERITTSYTQTLWGTLARRAQLKQVKYFDCNCKRCEDVSEFGTYAGSIYCLECRRKNKSEDCPKMVSTNPLDSTAVWKCQNCEHTIGARQMVWGNEAIRSEISKLEKSCPKSFEEFLDKYKDTLHSKNYHCLDVKYALTQLYGNVDGYLLSDLSDEVLERKIQLCHELLEVAELLEPGLSKFRGSLMYDLQAAMVVQAKRQYESNIITKEAAKETLEDSLKILQESAKILSTEPGMKKILKHRLEKFTELLDFEHL